MIHLRRAILLSQALRCIAASAPFVEWSPCETAGNTTTGLLCSRLAVPRDYTNLELTDTIELELTKSTATREPFLGSILINFGGPGDDGRSSLETFYETMQHVSGGQHDLVTWDPRGTGKTMPMSCFNSEAARTEFWDELSDQATNASEVAARRAWAMGTWLAQVCESSVQANVVGEVIGTTFTARDVMQIVDALNEDGLLRFWGLSYGTALGETVAAMFPDRMDKIVLDANLNPSEYWAGGSVSQLADIDAAFESFLVHCLEIPDDCQLAAQSSTVEDLSSQLYSLFDTMKYKPIVFGNYGIVTYASIKSEISFFLRRHGGSEYLALLLNSLLTHNETQYAQAVTLSTIPSPDNKPYYDATPAVSEARLLSIRCGDEELRSDNLEGMLPLLDAYQHQSQLLGDVLWSVMALVCAQWPFQAKERLTPDDFHDIRTKNPMLFINNQYDSVTSVEAARNASAAFVGSKLVVNEGLGHCALPELTSCAKHIIRAYLRDGILPEENETFCSLEGMATEDAEA